MSTLSSGPHLLAFDFGWGHLQHHDQGCAECESTGVDGYAEECDVCDGEGTIRWGSFYVQDHARCGTCKRYGVPVAEMYGRDDGYESAWVCLPCYVEHHRKACGCDRWAEAEAALMKESA